MMPADSQILARNTTLERLKYLFLVFAAVTSSRCWSYKGIPDPVYDALEFITCVTLIIIVVLNYAAIKNSIMMFEINVLLFITIPLISAVAASFFHDQPPLLSFGVLRTNFLWLLYFVLHLFNLSSKKIVRLIIGIGTIWILITIIQQFTFPIYYFYTRSDTGQTEFLRAGVYRFMIDPFQYGLFVLLYFFTKLLIKKKPVYLLWVLLGMAGFYYYSTRQLMVGSALSMAIAVLMQRGATRVVGLALFTFLVVVALIFQEQLFGDYVAMTSAQLSNVEDVRMLAARFFLFDYWPNWFAVITGNGFEHLNSPYGREMVYINTTYGFYKSDVGIIGALNTYGIVYVATIFFTIIKALSLKIQYKKNYLKLFFWFALLLLIISEQFSYPSAIPFYCFILYLIDKTHYKKVYVDNPAT